MRDDMASYVNEAHGINGLEVKPSTEEGGRL
jgi:hypothetical protein